MSEENVQLLRQVFDAWRRGDTAALAALLKPRLAAEFAWHPLYLDRVYSGYDGIWELWADLAGFWQDYRYDLEEIVDLGEHLLVRAHVTGRGPGSGVPIDQRIAILIAFRGEKAVWAKTFVSEREALEAAGVRA